MNNTQIPPATQYYHAVGLFIDNHEITLMPDT